jgi:transglutaminase-like putative cysteine protease
VITKALNDLTYRLEQQIRYEYAAPVTNLRQRLVVVPRTPHGPQRSADWTIAVQGAEPSAQRTTTDQFGNTVVDIVVERIDASVTFLFSAMVVREGRHDTEPQVTRSHRWYLSPTPLTQPDDEIRSIAAMGIESGDPAETMCSLVHRSLRYEWGTTGVSTPAAEALQGGRGVCQDYAHIMLSACRAAGIPARYVSGHLIGEGGTHAWVEVLTRRPDSRRYVVEAWDPTHDGKTDASYITVAVGRDYADVAPMSGIYFGDGVENRLSVVKTLVAV